jgi:hypothetical protein
VQASQEIACLSSENQTLKQRIRDAEASLAIASSQIVVAHHHTSNLVGTTQSLTSQVQSLQQKHTMMTQELEVRAANLVRMEKHLHIVEELHCRHKRKMNMYRNQLYRTQRRMIGTVSKAHVDARRFRLKSKGIFKPEVRSRVVRLRAAGVPGNRIDQVIQIAAEMFGGSVEDRVDQRNVGRFTSEVGQLAKMQIVHEMSRAECKCNVVIQRLGHF